MENNTLELMVPTFDWYQFTTPENIKTVLEVLDPLQTVEPFSQVDPKLKGYGWAMKTGGRGGSCLIHFGGPNGDKFGPNVAGTGPLAVNVATLFRGSSLPHSVGRVDVRQDALADFDTWRKAFISRCNQAGMATSDRGSCPESIKQLGRTVYGGATSSAYQPTIYEKGLQLGADYPRNYVRLEHRFAFSKAAEKQQLSVLSPSQMIGLRPVARDLSNDLIGLAVAPYKLESLPTERRPYFWMLKHYGPVLMQMIEEQGPSAIGYQIQADLKEMEDAH